MNLSDSGRLLGLTAVVFTLSIAQAQDTPSHEDMAARHLQQVQERLDLSPQQAALVRDALAKRELGSLWSAAAQLAPTLTATQQDRLTTPPARPERTPRVNQGGHPPRREHAANTERPERPSRTADFEAMKAARNTALGLRPEQVAAFDRLAAERRQPFEQLRDQTQEPHADGQPRSVRAQLSAEVAEILDPEQETVWLTFQALAPHHRGPRGPRPERN